MKIYLSLLLSLASFALCELPQETENHLSSTHASYDGNALVLEGNVALEHGLGNMNAEKALLQKQEAGKDFPFSLIQLKNSVLLSLKNRAELKCDSADLDFNALKGLLSSHSGGKVSYKDSFSLGDKPSLDFQMTSSCIDLQFVRSESLSKASEYAIASLKAKKEVHITYGPEITLDAEEASYQNESPQHRLLEAYSLSKGIRCLLLYQGEKIEADKIQIDLAQDVLHLQNPIGALPSHLFNSQENGSLFFRCLDLSWDHKKEVLHLNTEVSLRENSIGTLYAEKEMRIQQGRSNQKKSVQSIQIDGLSRLEHENPSSGWKHHLTCFGSLHVDGTLGHIHLTSPPEESKHLFYEDPQVRLRASSALIEYAQDSDCKPLSMTLQGNVTIESAAGTPLRRGIGDRLTYSPDTQTAILSALPKKRVLFQDEEQGIFMSAQEVHLTQDPMSGKMQVKGIGNVQFTLSAEETAFFQQKFSRSQGV